MNVKRIYRVVILTILCISIFVFYVFADSPDDLLPVSPVETFTQETSIESVSLMASPVTPNTSNGFHKVIIQLLGNYEPITVDYEYRTGNNTYTTHNINTAPDWSWICSCAIFGLVIYCVFRLIGSVFSGVRSV